MISLCSTRPHALRKESRSRSRKQLVPRASANPVISLATEIQLGTAKLPKGTSASAFASGMFQWASTLTISGQNMPFALPLQTDRLDNGFEILFLRGSSDGIARVAKIAATVERYGEADVLMIRFKAGDNPFPDGRVPKADSDESRLEALLASLVDVPLIMNTMKNAIVQVSAASRSG